MGVAGLGCEANIKYLFWLEGLMFRIHSFFVFFLSWKGKSGCVRVVVGGGVCYGNVAQHVTS